MPKLHPWPLLLILSLGAAARPALAAPDAPAALALAPSLPPSLSPSPSPSPALPAASAAGATAANHAGAPATVLDDETVYEVHRDGSHVQEETSRLRINDERGVRAHAQAALAYSTSLQRLEIVEAYTQTPDGRRIDVTPDKILLQQAPQSAGAPMFDDSKVKVVVYPAVEVGSVLALHVRRTQLKPLFPGQFSMYEGIWSVLAYDRAAITLKAPRDLALQVDARGLEGGRVAAEGDQQVWRWTSGPTRVSPIEPNAPSPVDDSPHVAATTFADFEAVGAAYRQRAFVQSEVTPAIERLAQSITAGIDEPRAQAEALYRWVSANIRYVAIFLEFGGVVPHAAEAIADARYGDCKDHVALYEALLRAKGIRSSPVLVNLGNVYRLPAVAVAPGVFNHVVTYLPDWNLYADTTAATAPFGVLPMPELGKPALLVDDGSGRARIVNLPIATPRADGIEVRTELELSADGTMKGASSVVSSGAFDWLTRTLLGILPRGSESRIVAGMLASTGQRGTGNLLRPSMNLAKSYPYRITFEMPDYATLPGPGAFSLPFGFTSLTGIGAAVAGFPNVTRTQPTVVPGRRIVETTLLTLPASLDVTAAPRGVELSNATATYRSSYRLDGRTLTIRREFELAPSGPTIDPAQYRAMSDMAAGISRDLRAQVLYR